MSILHSPKSQGFADQLAQVDRCQIALLREFSGGNGRLVLKGRLARDHLLPYIPPAVRHTIDADKWDEYILVVNDHLERWLDAALVLAQAREAAPEGGGP